MFCKTEIGYCSYYSTGRLETGFKKNRSRFVPKIEENYCSNNTQIINQPSTSLRSSRSYEPIGTNGLSIWVPNCPKIDREGLHRSDQTVSELRSVSAYALVSLNWTQRYMNCLDPILVPVLYDSGRLGPFRSNGNRTEKRWHLYDLLAEANSRVCKPSQSESRASRRWSEKVGTCPTERCQNQERSAPTRPSRWDESNGIWLERCRRSKTCVWRTCHEWVRASSQIDTQNAQNQKLRTPSSSSRRDE